MNTAIRKLPPGLGAGFAESMPAQNAKHLELMRLLDSQVAEHLAWSSDEPPAPSEPDTLDPQPPAAPVPGAASTSAPTEWDDTVFDPSSAIDVVFTEPDAAPARTPVPRPRARPAWQVMQASVPWLMLLFASIPVTVWLTLEWSESAPAAAAAVVDKPQAAPATKPAPIAMAAAPQANPAPAPAAAAQLPVVAAAPSSPAPAPADMPVVHDGNVAAAAPTPSAQAKVPPAATRSRPTDPAACAESRAALGLCNTPPGPSTVRPGVKP
jgi:ribonuclease E